MGSGPGLDGARGRQLLREVQPDDVDVDPAADAKAEMAVGWRVGAGSRRDLLAVDEEGHGRRVRLDAEGVLLGVLAAVRCDALDGRPTGDRPAAPPVRRTTVADPSLRSNSAV